MREGWSVEGVHSALDRSNVIGLLQDPDGNVLGYAFYSTPDRRLFEDVSLF